MALVRPSDQQQEAAPGHGVQGTGELATRIRSFPWADTPLGAIESWPGTLLDTVNLMLAAPFPMQLLWGPDRVVLYNDALCNLLGKHHPAALGHGAGACSPEAYAAVRPILDACFDRGESRVLHATPLTLHLNGSPAISYWDLAYSPVRTPAGEIAGVLNICTNVTEAATSALALRESQAILQEAEASFRQSEERLRMVLQAANGLGTWDWDLVGHRVYADRVVAEVFGVDPARAAAGCPEGELFNAIHPEDRDRVASHMQDAIRSRAVYACEYRLAPQAADTAQNPPGRERWVFARGRCQYNESGSPVRFTGITLDISDRKATEQALVRNEKLAAVGRLASSIAHEINNPLESVTNLLYLLRTSAVGEQIEYLDTAERELRRVSAIANQTLRFYRQSSRPSLVTCEDLLGDALSIFQGRLVNFRIEVSKRKRARCPVLCLEGEIRQVLSNLIGNAIDAMQHGGCLWLRSREATHWQTGRRGLVLTVADSGTGMDPDTAARAFDAFYTTKGFGGTGLGLWISKEIVDRQKGALSFRTRRNRRLHGTVFTLFLPFGDPTADAATPSGG